MWFGGNNYGRVSAASVTTMYEGGWELLLTEVANAK